VGKTATSAQKVWVEAMQRRVAATARALANIKGLKMTGLTNFIDAELHDLRTSELKKSRRIRVIICLTAAISTTTLPILTTVTIMVYVLVNRDSQDFRFDSALVFTMLSLISLLARPVQDLAFAIPDVGGGIGCLQRIQKYLLAREEIQESESSPPESESSKDNVLEDLLPLSDKDALITIQDADFSFQEASKPVLHDISLKIPKGSWTILTGPVGGGKSALLLAILGELRQLKGPVRKRKLLPIAFCAQEPWLPNTTLREIVTGFSEYDSNWYSKVIDACVLSFDIKELARGDQTVIGSGGISLSGGQQQRLSLARALYSRKPLLLLDDVLCGLDPVTEQKIVDNVFGQSGLCRKNGTTVFLATHSGKCQISYHILYLFPIYWTRLTKQCVTRCELTMQSSWPLVALFLSRGNHPSCPLFRSFRLTPNLRNHPPHHPSLIPTPPIKVAMSPTHKTTTKFRIQAHEAMGIQDSLGIISRLLDG
jgi:ABC-type multidrug transport system fused ATPase/permease subunit